MYINKSIEELASSTYVVFDSKDMKSTVRVSFLSHEKLRNRGQTWSSLMKTRISLLLIPIFEAGIGHPFLPSLPLPVQSYWGSSATLWLYKKDQIKLMHFFSPLNTLFNSLCTPTAAQWGSVRTLIWMELVLFLNNKQQQEVNSAVVLLHPRYLAKQLSFDCYSIYSSGTLFCL